MVSVMSVSVCFLRCLKAYNKDKLIKFFKLREKMYTYKHLWELSTCREPLYKLKTLNL